MAQPARPIREIIQEALELKGLTANDWGIRPWTFNTAVLEAAEEVSYGLLPDEKRALVAAAGNTSPEYYRTFSIVRDYGRCNNIMAVIILLMYRAIKDSPT